MRYLLIIFLLSSFFSVRSQDPIGLTYQRNLECVSLYDYDNLILSNTSYLLTNEKKSYTLLYGLEIQESLFGQFGGFYVFGFSADCDYKINTLPVSININTFLGGGGGASAPDGSGLSYRYAYGLKTHLNQYFDFLLRYSHYRFPDGEIHGSQWQAGLSYSIDSIFNRYARLSKFSNQSISFQVILMSLDQSDSYRLDDDYIAKLVGIEYSNAFNSRLDALIRLQAAISDQVDGFMAYYSGLSYKLINHKPLMINIKSLIGSGGGGAMKTGGGLSYLLETGIGVSVKNKTFSINAGHNSSHIGDFESNYIQLGLQYNYQSTIGISNKTKTIFTDELQISKLSIKSGFALHKAPNDIDYNSKKYKDIGLFSFGANYPINDRFDLIAETRWAALGDYGAYAEGIIGISSKIFNYKNIHFSLPLQLIVAGGGGVDVGKGIGVQFNIHANYKLSKNTSLSVSVGKMNMYKGNYDPLSFNVSVSQDLFFPLKY